MSGQHGGTALWRQQDKIRVLKLMGKVAGSVQPNLTRPDTVADDFGHYGGDQLAQSASSALAWLQVARMESTETWSDSIEATASFDAVNFREGLTGRKLASTTTNAVETKLVLASNTDFNADGRFTADDFVTLAIFVSNAADITYVSLQFIDSTADYYHVISSLGDFAIATGWNYIEVKKSAFRAVGTPDWTDIEEIAFTIDPVAAATSYVTFDNLQIVKADPSDGTVPSATFGHWVLLP